MEHASGPPSTSVNAHPYRATLRALAGYLADFY